jgi:hypothetical protein
MTATHRAVHQYGGQGQLDAFARAVPSRRHVHDTADL